MRASNQPIESIPAGARWAIPSEALEASFREMAADGDLDREGIALWAGLCSGALDEEVVVAHVVLLRGSGVCRARGFIRLGAEVLNEVTDLLESLGDGVYLAGHIHGHPRYCSTDLSPTDVMYGIRAPNYLSVVSPDYGQRGHNQLADCGIHLFESRAGWRRLPAEEVSRRIIIRQADVAVHTVTAHANDFDIWKGDE